MLIEQLTLTNILSFGPEPETVTFGPLTVLIGANGSGKSNLLEVIDLLRNAPDQLLAPIQRGGGFQEWIWKGDKGPGAAASVDCNVLPKVYSVTRPTRYMFSFGDSHWNTLITRELIERTATEAATSGPHVHYRLEPNGASISTNNVINDLLPGAIDMSRSVLAQFRDPVNYPEITALTEAFGLIRLYREWSFGRHTGVRLPQRTDMPTKWLEPDASTLGLILHKLGNDPGTRARIVSALKELYDGIDNFGVDIESGHVGVFLQEGDFKIPATRLSDGTLRYLCLLAILCHPNPPPLVCIEEPELGLHPDIIRTVAKLLREASERCQLIVTTHSEVLVDAMTNTPEAIVVCEKVDGATKLNRLSAEEMVPWLEKYRLGELWTSGQIGGNRW